MHRNSRLSRAILAAINACAAAHAASPTTGQPSASPAGESPSGELGEIIVTAQRRNESVQDVPITLQVLTGEALSQLNVSTLDDFLKYLPNVTTAGSGPAQGDIYMRGLATGFNGEQGAGTLYSFPSVAVYLDDQPGQLPGRNLDIYAADLERIEVLEGPQGTLFGAGAQAGVVRYITNKPKINVTEGTVNAGYAITSGGDPSTSGDATINLPLIEDTLAVRAVIYDEARGGYINNIPSVFSRSPEDKVSVNYFGGAVPPNSGPINNYAEAGNAINPVTYKGLRVSALWKFSDNWQALLAQSYQSIDADGVFWQEAYDGLAHPLPDRSVELFNPSYDKDTFEDTQLTINGRIRDLQLVYTGGFLDRHSDQKQDYTNYSRGVYAGYYQCAYPGYPFTTRTAGGQSTIVPTPNSKGYCWSPSMFWMDEERSTHQNHELRLSTPDDWRLRGIGGIFWEDYSVGEAADYFYGTSPNLTPLKPPANATSLNPGTRPLGDAFYTDLTRGYKQKAAFLSVDFDLLPKVLTFTAGTRYYSIHDFEDGSNEGSFGCQKYGPYNGDLPPNPCTIPYANGVNLNALNLGKTYTGFKSRANLTWHVSSDILLYYTWSQGFRPGGFNRPVTIENQSSPLYGVYKPPLAFDPDVLTNNEIGWKSEWFTHRLQWNGAVYQENWDHVQVDTFDPGVTGLIAFNANGPNYRVRGIETSLVARPIDPLTITAAASSNSSEVVKTVDFVGKNGQPIILAVNPFGELGTPLANAPSFQGNLRARYEIPIRDYRAFWQAGVARTGGSYSSTNQISKTLQGNSIDFYQPGYTTYNAALGVAKGGWTAQFYGENLTDSRGQLNSFYAEWVKAETIIRPRTMGLRFSYSFKEGP
jgi:iron complex outermembrane recepter protein